MKIPSKATVRFAILSLLCIASGSQAQTTSETLSFDNNQLPSGWSLFGGNGNIQITNQRVEMGQVDNYGGVYKSFDLSNAAQVKIEYDGNIANVFWGQGNQALLINDITRQNLNPADNAYAGMKKNGYGENTTTFYSYYVLDGTYINTYSVATTPPVFGNYHMAAVFQDGQITQTVTNLDTGATFTSGVTEAPGMLLSNMHFIALKGWTTTGDSAWIDNATITVTAVPEPETYAMLLVGLSVIGAIERRRRTVTAQRVNPCDS